jgi:hypothetical protein
MAKSTIATQVLQTLDIKLYLTTEITFYFVLSFEYVTNLTNLSFCEIIGPRRAFDLGLLDYLESQSSPNSVNIR